MSDKETGVRYEKLPPRRLVIKENHSTMVKYNKLWALADELGITLEFNNSRTLLNDTEFPGRQYYLEDIERGESSHTNEVMSFPYHLETKIVFENPDYEKLMDERHERQRKEMEEKQARENAAREEAERLRAEAAAAALKAQELKELQRLKSIYEA